MNNEELIKEALKAKEKAYAPYSGLKVGSALLAKSGRIFYGCNVENASFAGTICAERVAIVKAVSEGEKDFEAIAVASDREAPLPPCGICRQVLLEFGMNIKVIMKSLEGEIVTKTVGELLPEAFTSAFLD